MRLRFYKLLYNYEASNHMGVKLVLPYYDNLKLQFITNTKYLIDWHVFFFGYYEKETNDLLFQYIKTGHVVVEAGANNGTETLLISRIIGEKGKVFAFEPIQHIYDTLILNLKLNHCNNVIAEALALGESNESVFFNVLSQDYCNQGMSGKYDEKSADEKVEVKQVTLDAWISQTPISRLDFIKMDIQGAEINLLRGAQKTIKKFRPVIFTEATSDFLSIHSLYEEISKYEYDVFNIQTNGILSLMLKETIVEGNWLAKPKLSVSNDQYL